MGLTTQALHALAYRQGLDTTLQLLQYLKESGLIMKTVVNVAISCVFFFCVATVWAQNLDELKNTTPEERAAVLTQKMTKSLSLDEKTSTEVSVINLKYAKETQTLMESNGPQLQKLMTFRKNSEAKDAELKAILTPEQYSEYLEGKSAMEARGKESLLEKFQNAH
ncbi:MAG: hypothetical protein R3E64_02745 [Halioglobus sp.]